MKYFLTLLCLLYSTSLYATTLTSPTCQQTDVQNTVNSSNDGDTVIVPAGTCTWGTSAALLVWKSITFQGAGVGSTIILDGGGVSPILSLGPNNNSTTRMTGFEFRDGGRVSTDFNGITNILGANQLNRSVRIDHCKFDHLNGVAIQPTNALGVIDHNTFLFSPTRIPIYVYDKNWSGSGGQTTTGDGAWADPTQFGTD